VTPEVFVKEFEELKEYIGEGYFSEGSEISRLSRLQTAGFSTSQIALTKELVSEALTDALYTVLLGLEGSASISRHQEMYKLLDESGQELTGKIESLAWERFHGKNT
jgi:hypothetical protein